MRNIIKEQSILRKLKLQLSVAYFLLGAVLASGVFVFWPQINGIAQALTGTYNKITGDQLTIADWNNLDNDFVAKSGDTMGGDLNMGGHTVTNLPNPTNGTDAVNLASVNSSIASAIGAIPGASIENISGDDLKMVCGRTLPSSWIAYSARVLYVDVVIPSSIVFIDLPQYLTSILGDSQHYLVTGSDNTYIRPNTPSGDRVFRVYISYPTDITPSFAQSNGWSLSWCAVGR